jgi:hypothetical protein
MDLLAVHAVFTFECIGWLDRRQLLRQIGSAIRRNMRLHDSPTKTIGAELSRSVMRRVRHARKNSTTKQLGDFMIADSFGSLTDSEFCILSSWSELVRKHNDPAIDYHVSLYEYIVIGYELIAARDVMRINMSSVWMLANTLCAIVAGCNFQLCADVTSNFCNRCVDLLELSVTSIPCQNIVLCWSIILKVKSFIT